jgi:hypothetical protein
MPLLLTLGIASCNSPLKPTPTQPIRGTYTLTVATSSSCSLHGSWQFRADIDQDGRDLKITLSEGKFITCIFGGTEINEFKGQDNPDGVLFFSRGGSAGQYVFVDEDAGAWSGVGKGPYHDDRIDAVFDGTFAPSCFAEDSCTAPDHSWTFVRRP